MDELLPLLEQVRSSRPAQWENFPDIALYMDQVLSYVNRQVPQPDALTGAMVNNYTKSHLLPRADGKRYNREHLAYLVAICILKQVLSVKDIDFLIQTQLQQSSVEERYGAMLKSLDEAMDHTAEKMEAYSSPEQLGDAAIHFALEAFAAGTACRRYVELLRLRSQGNDTGGGKQA